MPYFGKTSRERMEGVDEDMIRLFEEVVKKVDCTILKDGGLRTKERQAELVAQGVSYTMNSRHLTGLALDVMPYPVDWQDKERLMMFATIVFATAQELGIKVRWGGHFKKKNGRPFFDGPHWEKVE